MPCCGHPSVALLPVTRVGSKASSTIRGQRNPRLASERLTTLDPNNTEWKRDFVVSHTKVGDILGEQGKVEEALKSYRAGFDLMQRLAGSDESNVGWQRDLTVMYDKIGLAEQARGNLDDALASYRA